MSDKTPAPNAVEKTELPAYESPRRRKEGFRANKAKRSAPDEADKAQAKADDMSSPSAETKTDKPTPAPPQGTAKTKSAKKAKDKTSAPLLLSPKEPLATARKFIKRRFTVKGTQTLRRYRGTFYVWDGACYQEMSDERLRKEVYDFLDGAVIAGTGGSKSHPQRFHPNRQKVSDVIDALKTVCLLPEDLEVPCWLDNNPVPVSKVLPCKNGLVNPVNRKVFPHNPNFFGFSVLNVNYSPEPKEPTVWHQFLDDLWGGEEDDGNAEQLLQQMFGYFLTQDTRHQKIFMIVGPLRSGKGTIARVLTALVGQENVVAPTLASLGQNFGLQPWIGKQLAVIADARFGGRNQDQVVERLLSISGEDNITIDRKYRDPWTGKLNTRVLILTNEIPALPDPSGAMAGRFVILPMTKSFFGKEDPQLTEKLLKELPGILDWALWGLKHLRSEGGFRKLSSAEDSIGVLEDLGSPVKAFAWDRCELGPGKRVDAGGLYATWRDWCAQQGRDDAGTSQMLGRSLKAAYPAIKTKQGTSGKRFYDGITLRAQADANADQRAGGDSDRTSDSEEDDADDSQSTKSDKSAPKRVGPRYSLRRRKHKKRKFSHPRPRENVQQVDPGE